MANYPTSLDAFTNPTSVDSLSAPSHSDQHANANDAIEALEAKVGIGTSTAGSATAGHVLVASSGGTTSWTTVGASAISTTGGSAGQYLSAGTAGVAQWADVTAAGLTLVKTQTIGTAVSSVAVTSAFSATYENYKIVISGGAASGTINLRLQLGSSTASYRNITIYGSLNTASGTPTSEGSTNAAYFQYVGSAGTNNIYMNCDVNSPYLSKYSSAFGTFSYDAGGGVAGLTTGLHAVASSYTDFTILTSSGTLTGGTIRVYGYRNS